MAASRNVDVTKKLTQSIIPAFFLGVGESGLNLSFGFGLRPEVEDEVRCMPRPGHTPNLSY